MLLSKKAKNTDGLSGLSDDYRVATLTKSYPSS